MKIFRHSTNVLLLIVLLGCGANEQKSGTQPLVKSSTSENIAITYSCNYTNAFNESNIVGFASDNDALNATNKIMKFTGLPANFSIMAANVSNACAVISGTKRYILYSQTFMEQVNLETQSHWAEASILAHEIGHHLSGHTLDISGSRPSVELEADKFSGFILAKMGATLDDALIAVRRFCPEEYSTTHPSKSARIAAIANGWKQASEIDKGRNETSQELITRTPSALISEEEINIFLNKWLQAQNDKLYEEYSGCYSNQFQGVRRTKSGGVYYFDYSDWLHDRIKMYTSAKNLNISIGNVQRLDNDFNGTTIKFIQKYSSDAYQDIGEKIMKLVKKGNGELRIVYEEMLNSN